MTSRVWALLLVLVLVAGYLGYLIHHKKIPCVTPITYKIVAYDSKFNISQAELQSDVTQAAQMWNDALGKQVFVEGDTDELPIYFQYGQVQRVVDTISSFSNDIDKTKQEADVVANQYGDLKKKFDAAKAAGTATQAMADQLNALAKKYNDLVLRERADVATSNSAVPQGDINEGEYVSDDNGTRIYIYGFQTKTELMRTLTHEFGHALGLGHVSNSDSIMYPVNKSDNLILTEQDLPEMKKVCGIK